MNSLGRRSRERGQTLVLTALLLVALVAILALVIDGGNYYLQRRVAQNAADSGALAGARALAMGEDEAAARAAASGYAGANGDSAPSVSIVGHTVTVTAHRTFPSFFAGIVGIRTFSVQAVASAEYGFPKTLGNLCRWP